MIDTHCHLTFPELSSRLPEVIHAAHAAGVDRMISIGTTPADAVNAMKIAQANNGVFFAAGIHPHYAQELENLESACTSLLELANQQDHVAFGEMGLDYHYPEPPKEDQFACFSAQLAMVKNSGIDKPIIIHSRKATDDSVRMIRESGIAGNRFVYHCFTESPDDVDKVLDLGAMVSFTGIVTYKNAPEVRESCSRVPADRLMLETDSPYLSPVPHRKVRPNEPKFVTATALFVAELRGVSVDDLIAQCDDNAERFFGLS